MNRRRGDVARKGGYIESRGQRKRLVWVVSMVGTPFEHFGVIWPVSDDKYA